MKKILSKFPNLFRLDLWILVPYLILCLIGVVVVYSASSNIGSPVEFMMKQALYVLIGIVILMFFSNLQLSCLRKMSLMGLMALVFTVVLFFLKFFGKSVNGSAGWLSIGPFNIQPSEVAKLFLVVYMANALAKRQQRYSDDPVLLHQKYPNRITRIFFNAWDKSMWKLLLFPVVIIYLIWRQPDLGGALINASIVIILIAICGRFSWRRVGTIAAILIPLVAGFIWLVIIPKALSPAGQNNYQLQRFVGVLRPFENAQGSGKQLVNSYYALSNGGIFGVGLGNSIQKMGYLPEPNTDFIMSIVAEELGLIGVIVILILLGIVVSRIVLIGIRDNDSYCSLVCYGVATYIMAEMFCNMGGVLGIMPITGVTFPFISYGGSSMLTLSAGIGIILNIARTQSRRGFQIKVTKK